VLETSTYFIFALGMLLFALGPNALLMGLIIASVLQAMAFINVGDSPIIVYYFFGSLFIVRALFDILCQPTVVAWSNAQSAPAMYLGILIALAAIGALLLPNIFLGLPVYSPKLGLDDQLNHMSSLAFEVSHLNQVAQLVVNALIVYILWLKPIAPTVLIRSITLGWAIVIFFCLWQLLANVTGIYFPEEYLYTVEGWSLGKDQMLGSFSRVNGPFVEPSLLATYLTGMFGFFLVLWIRKPTGMVLLALLLTVFSMLITVSSTAYISLMLILLAALFCFGLVPLIRGGWIYHSIWRLFISLVILALILAFGSFASSEMRELIDLVLFEKSEGDSFLVRFDADIQSAQMVWQTYGMGVGLGGNRPSSFLLFLLSNVGLVGFALFALFIFSLSRLAFKQMISKDSSASKLSPIWVQAAVWGFWATILAKIIAQPDLSFAPMWIWIFLLASFSAIRRSTLTTSPLLA
jgi:hypothetical protein